MSGQLKAQSMMEQLYMIDRSRVREAGASKMTQLEGNPFGLPAARTERFYEPDRVIE